MTLAHDRPDSRGSREPPAPPPLDTPPRGRPESGAGGGAPRPLRIALLGSRGIPASYSGAETFYEQLGVRLAERGHQVTVYNRSHHVRYRGQFYRGVRLVRLPSIPTKHLDTITHTFLSIVHALVVGYDIYYVFIVGNSPLCLLTRLAGRRSVLNVDGADHAREKWGRLASAYLRWTERVACRLADVVIADAEVIQRRYRDLYGRDSVFVPYGANVDPRADLDPGPAATRPARGAVLERFGLEPGGYVLFVSRLTPENGAHVLMEAFRRADTGLRLAVVGDAPYAGGYKRRLRRCGDERVVMTGYLFGDAYREISRNCLFFVLPSGIDGTRPVLLDQMGFGNCVLVKNTPANLEVVGDAGLAYDREDEVASLAARLATLARDPETIAACRRRAVARVRERYSWEGVTDRYERLFLDLAERRPSAGSPPRAALRETSSA